MKVLTNNQYYSDIADTIRQMKGVATTYKPREMASALKDIYSNEVEGVPPLTFQANGNNLLNYRIDGANGGVGDLVTDTSDENYGKYKVPVIINGKNLLQMNATTQTVNGVTFTINNNGTVTCNGTATDNIFFPLTGNNSIENIIINGCPAGGGGDSYLVRAIDTNGRVLKTDVGEGTEVFNLINARIQIRIAKYYICNNLTFYPMIRLATIEDDAYEPYINPTTTNIYLDEPIEVNESKELSDTNVNIPTINGTNILSIDTTIQPSNVYVQAPKTNNYNL